MIERSGAAASLLVHIIISKYCDHLPLHRQEQIYERYGVELSRKRMSEWLLILAEKLTPIALAIKASILAKPYVQADETRIEVQAIGKCLQGYLWSILGPPNDAVYYEYNQSRSSESAQNLILDFIGYLQTDAFGGYNNLPVSRLACLAHVRRKFIEAPDCKEKDDVLKIIAKIYSLDSKAKDKLLVRQTEIRA